MNMAVEIINVYKSFSGVEVLHNINFGIEKGTIHAIVGENGAGKSTLMKILYGELQPTQGQIKIFGKVQIMHSPREALEKGIALIHQEFSLVPYLPVYENIFMGREILYDRFIKHVNKKVMKARSEEIFKHFGILSISGDDIVKNLSVGKKQLVEIAKALSVNAQILIMDEPTASLGEEETHNLFSILKLLKKEGVTIIFISHRLEELFEIADKVTIMKDGEIVDTKNIEDISLEEVIEKMVGRRMENRFPPKPLLDQTKDVVLEVRSLTLEPYFKQVSFKLKKGEILGIAGLIGCGNTELLESLVGLYRVKKGEVFFEGSKLDKINTKSVMKRGIYLIPENRAEKGLVLIRSIKENLSLPNLDLCSSKLGVINASKENSLFYSIAKLLSIKFSNPNQKASSLSGGNQQKIVIGKWLPRSPSVLLLCDPTRGIDVEAKYEIYKFIFEEAMKGVSIIFTSSDNEEILSIATRILVMGKGKITGEVDPSTSSERDILNLSTKT